MATVEATKKRRLTQEDCDTVRYLLKYGRTLKEIAEIIHVDPSTVGKIRLADYDLPTYLEQRKAMNRKTAENKRAAEAGRRRLAELLEPLRNPEAEKAIMQQMDAQNKKEEEMRERMKQGEPIQFIPGQTKMNLDALAEEPEKKEPDEQTKQMRFQAALMDKLLKKLDELIDVMRGGAEA